MHFNVFPRGGYYALHIHAHTHTHGHSIEIIPKGDKVTATIAVWFFERNSKWFYDRERRSTV